MTILPISVIIPVRNDAPTLTAAVESALAADAGEVVIVNDASTDDTIHVAMGMISGSLGRVRLINSPLDVRGGVCFARNLGISSAHHPLIVPLDADDTLLPFALYRLNEATISYDFAYGNWIEEGATRTALPLIRLPKKNVSQATWIFTKSMWAKVGGYNPTFELGCEDWALMLAFVEGGYEGLKIDEPTHVRHNRPDGRAAACYARRDAILGLLREHFPKTMGVSDAV